MNILNKVFTFFTAYFGSDKIDEHTHWENIGDSLIAHDGFRGTIVDLSLDDGTAYGAFIANDEVEPGVEKFYYLKELKKDKRNPDKYRWVSKQGMDKYRVFKNGRGFMSGKFLPNKKMKEKKFTCINPLLAEVDFHYISFGARNLFFLKLF